jgi:hypothetical protein
MEVTQGAASPEEVGEEEDFLLSAVMVVQVAQVMVLAAVEVEGMEVLRRVEEMEELLQTRHLADQVVKFQMLRG